MSKRFFIIYFCFFLILLSFSQNVDLHTIASDGGHSITSTAQISWTIGEAITDTYAGPSNIITKGFQQPSLTVVASHAELNFPENIRAYPNPAYDYVQFDFSKIKQGNYLIEIYGLAGELLKQTQIEIDSELYQQYFSLSDLSKGLYVFRITNSENSSRYFRISKQ